MGRFYQTAKPDFIEGNIYTPPVDLMASVIANTDAGIQKNESALLDFYKNLKAQGLKKDEPRLKEILDEFKGKINAMSSEIQSDPLAFRKKSGDIKVLGQELTDQWSNGEVSKIQGNKAIFDDWKKQLNEQIKDDKTGRFTPDLVEKLVADKMNSFNTGGGTNYKSPGEYNPFATEDMLALGNIPDLLQEGVGKFIKSDGKETKYDKDKGRWVVRKGDSWERVTKEKLEEAARAYINATPSIANALNQRRRLSVDGYTNSLDLLNAGVNSFIKTNEYEKTTDERTLSSNDAWMQDRAFAHAIEMKKLEDPITEVETLIKQSYDNPVGSTAGDYALGVQANNKSYNTNKSKILASTTNPVYRDQIARGDYRNMPKTVDNYKAMEEMKSTKNNMRVLEAAKNEFLESLTPEERKQAIDKNGNIIILSGKNAKGEVIYHGTSAKFDSFIKDTVKNNTQLNDLGLRRFFENDPAGAKKIEGYNDNAIESGIFNNAVIEFPQGARFVNKKWNPNDPKGSQKYVDVKGTTTIKDLIETGVISSTDVIEEDGKIKFDVSTTEGKKMDYSFSKNLQTTGVYGNSGKIEYYTGMTVNGTTTKVRIDNIRIPEVEQYASDHIEELKAKHYISTTPYKNVTLHDSHGGKVIFQGKAWKDKNNNAYEKGDILLYDVKGNLKLKSNSNNPEGLKILMQALKTAN